MKNVFRDSISGFTLIELLVVVLIIGILSAVSLPQYTKAVQKSRFVQLQIIVRNLFEAQKRYYMENGEYATEFDLLDVLPDGEISETKDLIRTDKYSCRFNNSYKEIHCTLSPDIGAGIIIYLLRDSYQPKCRPTSEEGNKLCFTYGGVLDSSGTSWTDYTFK